MATKSNMSTAIPPIPTGYHALTPYLVVKNAGAALEFYKKAFSATETRRINSPSGQVSHAELRIGDSQLMLTEEMPQMGMKSPQTLNGCPVNLVFYVTDADSFTRKAVDAGAILKHAVENKFFGDRMGTIEDPFGHIWHIATHVEDMSDEEMQRRSDEFIKSKQSNS